VLAGVDVVLSDDILDRIDEIVPPGTDIGTLDQAYVPPSVQRTDLRAAVGAADRPTCRRRCSGPTYVPPSVQRTDLRRRPLRERAAA